MLLPLGTLSAVAIHGDTHCCHWILSLWLGTLLAYHWGVTGLHYARAWGSQSALVVTASSGHILRQLLVIPAALKQAEPFEDLSI